MIQFFSRPGPLDALLTFAGNLFLHEASTVPVDRTRDRQAGCTKQLPRVCLRPFRDGDCDLEGSRPRKGSRAVRRRFKRTARPGWRSWARGDSTSPETNPGDTPPVGSVSTF